MARDQYPDEVELIRSIDDASDKQKRAAGLIDEQWGTSFNTLEEEFEGVSRSTLERTRDKFFGPEGTTITFGEIKEQPEFDGRVKNWMQAKRRGSLDDNGWPKQNLEIDEEKREEIYQEGREDGYNEGYDEGKEDGRKEGYEDGFERGQQEGRINGIQEGWLRLDHALLDALDDDAYREIRAIIDESSTKQF